jgi:hypothetical protein
VAKKLRQAEQAALEEARRIVYGVPTTTSSGANGGGGDGGREADGGAAQGAAKLAKWERKAQKRASKKAEMALTQKYLSVGMVEDMGDAWTEADSLVEYRKLFYRLLASQKVPLVGAANALVLFYVRVCRWDHKW